MGIGEKFKPVGGFQAVEESSTEASSSIFQLDNEATTRASTSMFQSADDSSLIFQSDNEAITSASTSMFQAADDSLSIFQSDNEAMTSASTPVFQATEDSSIESLETQKQGNSNLPISNLETVDLNSPAEVSADVGETEIVESVLECPTMDNEQQPAATDTNQTTIVVSQPADQQLEIRVNSSISEEMDKEVIENSDIVKTNADVNESTDQNKSQEDSGNSLLEEAERNDTSNPDDEEKLVAIDAPVADDRDDEESAKDISRSLSNDMEDQHQSEVVKDISQQIDEFKSLLETTTFFAVDDMDLPPLPAPLDAISLPPLSLLPAEESYKIPMPSLDLEKRCPTESIFDSSEKTVNPSLLNLDFDDSIVDSVCDIIPKSKILLGKALARKRLKAFSQSKLNSFSTGLEALSSKSSAALSFSLTKKINPKVQADMEAVFNDEEEEEQQQQQQKKDDNIEAKLENQYDAGKSTPSKTEKKSESVKSTASETSDSERYPNQPLDTYSVKPNFDFLTFVKTDLIKGTEDDKDKTSPSGHERKSKSVEEDEHNHTRSERRHSRSKEAEQDSYRGDKYRTRDESTERERYRRYQSDRKHDRFRDRHRSDRYRSGRYRDRSWDRSPESRYRNRSRERSRDYRTSKSSHYSNEDSEYENQKSSKSRDSSRSDFSAAKEKMPKVLPKEPSSEVDNNSTKKSPNESDNPSISPKISVNFGSEDSVPVTASERSVENLVKTDGTENHPEKSDTVEGHPSNKVKTPESNTGEDFITVSLPDDTSAPTAEYDIGISDEQGNGNDAYSPEGSFKDSNESSPANLASPAVHLDVLNETLHSEVHQAASSLDTTPKTTTIEPSDSLSPKEDNHKTFDIKAESQEDFTPENNTVTEEQQPKEEPPLPRRNSKPKPQKSKKSDHQDMFKKMLKDKTLKELLTKQHGKSRSSARKALKTKLKEVMETLLTLEESGSSSSSSSESEETSSSSDVESGKLSKTSNSSDSVSSVTDDQQSKGSPNLNSRIVSSSSSKSPEGNKIDLNEKPHLEMEEDSKHCLPSPMHVEGTGSSVKVSPMFKEASNPVQMVVSDEASSSGSSSSSSKSAEKTTESSSSSDSESSVADTKSEVSADQTSNSVKTDSDSSVKVKAPSKETRAIKRNQDEKFDDSVGKARKKVKLETSSDAVGVKKTMAPRDSEIDLNSRNEDGNGQVYKIQSIITVRDRGSFQNKMVSEEGEGSSKKSVSSSSTMVSRDSSKVKAGRKTKRQRSQSPPKRRSKHRIVARYTQCRPSIKFCCNRKCGDFVCVMRMPSASSSPMSETSEASQTDVVNMNALQALQTSYGHSSLDFKEPKEESEPSFVPEDIKSPIPKNTEKVSETEKLPIPTSPVVSKCSPEDSAKTAPAAENYVPVPKVKSKWDTDSESNSETQWSPLVKDIATTGESPVPQPDIKVKLEPTEATEVETTKEMDIESKSSLEQIPAAVSPTTDCLAPSSISPKVDSDAVAQQAASDSNVLASEYDEFLKLLNLEASQKVNYPPTLAQSGGNFHRASTNSDSAENLPSQEVSNCEPSGDEQVDKFKINSNLEFHVGLVTTAVYPMKEANVLMKHAEKKMMCQKAETKDPASDHMHSQNTQQINTEILNNINPVVIDDNSPNTSNHGINTCKTIAGLVDPRIANSLLPNAVSSLAKVNWVKQVALKPNSEVSEAPSFNLQKNKKHGLSSVDSPVTVHLKVPVALNQDIPLPITSHDLSNAFASPTGKIAHPHSKQSMPMENGQPFCNSSPRSQDGLTQGVPVKTKVNSMLESCVLPESTAEIPISQADMLVSSTSCEAPCSEVAVSEGIQMNCTFQSLVKTNKKPVGDETFLGRSSDRVDEDKKIESQSNWDMDSQAVVDDSLDYKYSPSDDIEVEYETDDLHSHENGTSAIFSRENSIAESPEFGTSEDGKVNRDVSGRVYDAQTSVFTSSSVSPVEGDGSTFADASVKLIPKDVTPSLLEHIAGRQSFSQLLASPQDRAVSSTDALDTTFRCNDINEAISSSSPNCASSEENVLELKHTIPLMNSGDGMPEPDKLKHTYRLITKHHRKSEKQGSQLVAKTPSSDHIRKPLQTGFPKGGILVSSSERRDAEKKSVTFADGVPPLKDPNIALMASPPPPPPPKDRRHKVKVKHIRTAVLTSKRSSSPPPPPPPPPKSAPPPPPPPKKPKDSSSTAVHIAQVTPEKQQAQYQLNYQPPPPGPSYVTTSTVSPQHTNPQIGCTVPYAYMPPYPVYTAPPPYAYAPPPPPNPAALPPNHGPPGIMSVAHGSLQPSVNNGPPPSIHGMPQIPPPSHGLVRPPPPNASVYMNSTHQVPYAYAMNPPLVTQQYPPPTNVPPPAPK